LLAAALLEAAGDALVRGGMRSSSFLQRVVLMAVGGLVLFLYGYAVNAPPWDFGKLLGVYVAFFFVVAQAIAWMGFGQKPAPLTIAGGALIVAGGYLVSLG
jgi:small multidrug resistance family-3 protein